jgi:hypothetical protein
VVAGPPVHEANLWILQDDADAAKASRARSAKALIQRGTPPSNIIGGYKFPGAPTLDHQLIRNILDCEASPTRRSLSCEGANVLSGMPDKDTPDQGRHGGDPQCHRQWRPE